jgi:ribosomal protein S18 acetylase RimI-like enzyme
MTMPHVQWSVSVKLRRGRIGDLDALVAIEQANFKTNLLSRRSIRHFLAESNGLVIIDENGSELARYALIVAEACGKLIGYALVFYPQHSQLARLYSIAVDPPLIGRRVGALLLEGAARAARRRGCHTIRLEVHETNPRAIAVYRRSGYRFFGKYLNYYDDHSGAQRFEKLLGAEPRRSTAPAGHPDSAGRIGFGGGHRGWRRRQSFRFPL